MFTLLLALTPLLVAQPADTQKQVASFEVLEAKITSAIQDRQFVDNKTGFKTGEKAWVWMKLRPSQEGQTMRIRWSADGKEVWTTDALPVRAGRSWYYKTLNTAGSWKAEILNSSGEVLQELTLTAAGEPVAAPSPSATNTRTEQARDAKQAGTSDSVSVVDCKFATEVKDRDPVTPATQFAKGSKVYAWIKLDVKAESTQIKLRWSKDGTVVHTSEPVAVRQSPGWRTWQYKTLDQSGAWSVEVLDANDTVVHTGKLDITP